MEPFGIGMAGLGVAGLASVGAFGLAFRQHRRRRAARPARKPRSAADRLEALAAAQAELGLRLDALAAQAPEEKLQAMAGQVLGLIRDKNATFETALAGLDQLRARMRALEQMGEPAEARALLERLGARLDELQAAEAARAAALEARVLALETPGGVAELAERLAKLHMKDAGIEAALGRLGPLEAKLGGLEGGLAPAREALKRLEARLEALAVELAALQEAPRAEIGQVLGRLAALEAASQAAPERLAERLAAAQAGLQGQIDALRDGPFAEIAGQLTRLYGQKDAAVETVLARLQPLEAKLAAMEGGWRSRGALLDRFAEQLEAVQGRVTALEGAENPFAEISEQLTRLYGQKDAAVETVLARLQPLEAKLAELERGQVDPQALLDRFAERLEAVQGRVTALEGAENPFAEISEQLTRLYGQKDAAVETVLARLQPLEAKLAEIEGGRWRSRGRCSTGSRSGWRRCRGGSRRWRGRRTRSRRYPSS